MNENNLLFKVMLIGDSGVGKSCLVRHFIHGFYPSGQIVTVGADFSCKAVRFGNDSVNLQIWDTAGQERFRSISQSYYRSAHAMVLVYDISKQHTFDSLHTWTTDINKYSNSSVIKILVGNKTDLSNREIPRNIGDEFAKQNNMLFYETSAKDASTVTKLFNDIAVILFNENKDESHPLNIIVYAILGLVALVTILLLCLWRRCKYYQAIENQIRNEHQRQYIYNITENIEYRSGKRNRFN